MDHFFLEDEYLQNYIFWYDTVPRLNQSAFQPYTSVLGSEISVNHGTNSSNLNKKMIEFMRRSFPVRTNESQESESARCYRRKVSERLRRENEKKGYLALHSILPVGTKNDKNSIMKMASKRIQELKERKEMLERRNYEHEVKLEAMSRSNNTKIEFKVAHPKTFGITYMVEVLKCLNSCGSNIISIQSNFSDEKLVAEIDIETQIADAEVRKEVQRTLQDVQQKLQFHLQED